MISSKKIQAICRFLDLIVRYSFIHIQVSNLLDAGKAAFMEMHNKWEEKIVFLHQQQMEEWEEGIEFLNGVDSLNEDINKRLQSAQMVIGFIHPATDDA